MRFSDGFSRLWLGEQLWSQPAQPILQRPLAMQVKAYGKSIRRDRIESEFDALLQEVTPSETLFRIARKMFTDLWAHRAQQAETQTKAMRLQLVKVEKQAAQLLDRILDASLSGAPPRTSSS